MKKYFFILICSLAFLTTNAQKILQNAAKETGYHEYVTNMKVYQDSVLYYKEKVAGYYTPAERKIYIEKYNAAVKTYKEQLSVYTLQNKDNTWSAVALLDGIYNQTIPNLEILEQNASNISESVLQNKYGKDLSSILQARKKIANQQLADLTLTNAQNKTVRLSEVKEKYILINFWASWCQPCRAENAQLRSLYKKYNSKGLEIVSISVDNNKKAWQSAAAQDNINWINLYADGGFHSQAALFYNVTGVPEMYLLRKENNTLTQNFTLQQVIDMLEK